MATIDISQGLPLLFVFDKKTKTTYATLLEDIPYIFKGKKHIIPRGFVTDGASIPRRGWHIIGHPFHMAYLKEAIFHDYLYATQIYPKEVADRMLFTDTKERLSICKRTTMYLALKGFGWVAWNRHARALKLKKEDNL